MWKRLAIIAGAIFIDIKNLIIDINKWIIDTNKWILDINKLIFDVNKDGCRRHLYWYQ